MRRAGKLLNKARAGGTLSFREFETLVGACGFVHLRTTGSHRLYAHPGSPVYLNIQPSGRDAKDYQVRQLLNILDDMAKEGDK